MSRWVVIGIGICVMLGGAALLIAPRYEAERWQSSPEAERALRNAEAPTPVWLTPTMLTAPAPAARATTVPPTAVAVTPVARFSAPAVVDARVDIAPTATPPISDVTLRDSAFAFEDPPEPGAHAHLTVTVHNPTDQSVTTITVSLPTTWLKGYRLSNTDPSAQSGQQTDADLRVSFDGPAAQADTTVALDFVTTDEVIDSPNLTVLDGDGRKIGDAHPPTQAPPPRPGPIYSIDIPRLKLHSGVVPVDWEPPLFVIGQVRDSAYVTQGNSVLLGHVRGAAGYNVFDHLDQLEVGDAVIANSRGAAYNFVVTETEVLPEDDTSPTDASLSARLTLMTCAGTWNPLTQDYSDRLWVIASPD
jgi:LPXTG-site transpeptidase (sortase) family protein